MGSLPQTGLIVAELSLNVILKDLFKTRLFSS